MFYKKIVILLVSFILIMSSVENFCFAADGIEMIDVSEVTFCMVNDGEERYIDNLSDARDISASVNISNFSGNTQNVIMILAYYSKAGVLKNLDLCEMALAPGAEEEFKTAVSITEETTEESEARVFIWDNTQRPVTAHKSIKGKKIEKRIYVSKEGNDENSGAIEAPFASIARAQEEVRKYNNSMNGDINVYLHEGTYRQEETLTFSCEDSGTNGYYVNYMSYPGEKASITGSREIKDWTPYNDTIWCAKVSGIDGAMQLYVNGARAERARSEKMYSVAELFDDADDAAYDKDGILVSGSEFSSYSAQSDIQLHFARGWRSYLLNVERIQEENGSSKFYMSQPGFNNVDKKSLYYRIQPGNMFWLENSMEELDTPGEFYYMKGTETLYYMPRENENMNTSQAELAVLDQLIDISGKDTDNKAHNITFSSLEFAHASWSRAAKAGHISDQAQDMAWDASDEIKNPGYTMVPSNISINRAEKIHFTDNVIRDMGCVGIGLYQGVNDCSLTGNVFCDLGDSAITIGMPSQAYTDEIYTGRNLVADKVVTASGSSWTYTPDKAIDVNKKSGWSSQDSGAGWWQIDLGEPYEIDRVDIADRADIDPVTEAGKSFMTMIRKNISIYASNDPEFNEYSVLFSNVGGEAWPDDEDVSYPIEDDGKYRYVRIAKSGYLYLADVRIINESMSYSPVNEICKSNLINNNYITRVGLTNYGAPGLQTYFTQKTEISNNYLCDLPYSGICVGWGWTNFSDSVTCFENKILNNKIEKSSQINFDGGAIYTLGQQSESIISGNYVKGALHVNGGIYLDNGTQHYTVESNVVEDVPYSFVASAYTYNNTWKNNFSSVVTYTNGLVIDETSSFEEVQNFIPGNCSDSVQKIISNTGLERGWEGIIKKADENLWETTEEGLWNNILYDVDNQYFTDEQFRRGYLERLAEAAAKWVEIAESSGEYQESAVSELKEMIETVKTFISEDKESPKGRQRVLEMRSSLLAEMNEFINGKLQ